MGKNNEITMSHVVYAIQITLALLVEHVLSLSPHDFKGTRLVEKLARLSAKSIFKIINKHEKRNSLNTMMNEILMNENSNEHAV